MSNRKTTSVSLRKKLLKDGKRESLYLDYYPPIPKKDGSTTRREFLGLYIFVGKRLTPEQKTTNKSNIQLAEHIRSERQISINKQDYGFFE